MKKIVLILGILLYGLNSIGQSIWMFSVSDSEKVCFSPGNLQWSFTNGGNTYTTHVVAGNGTAAGTWRFAPNQWDTIGARNVDSSYFSTGGWIDLFGWGTSGYNNRYPYMRSITNTDYANDTNGMSGTNYDWGMYNAIYNPKTQTTDAPGTWRTLTYEEWMYLFNRRSTASAIRYACGVVMGVSGIIIVPDNCNSIMYPLVNVNRVEIPISYNFIGATIWAQMEAVGCVFLPLAGSRSDIVYDNAYYKSYYWSASVPSYDASLVGVLSRLQRERGLVIGLYDGLEVGYRVGKSYGASVRLVRDLRGATLNTKVVNNITSTTAQSGGNITSDGGATVTARGICWSTLQNPTINDNYTSDGSGTGSYTSTMTGLKANTVYYVRAYATNAMGTTYGNVIPFTTIATTIPTLTTIITSNITSTTAQSGGNITSDGGTTITARGVCWSTSQNPTINDNHTSDGSGAGSFTSTMAGLKANTVYYVRAYATNAMGTAYGNQITFTTTANLPSLTTITISKITATSATGGGNITSNGGTSLIARGVCWGTSHNPTINGNHTFDGSGTGSFTSNITGLTAGTTYYVRAYAVNAVGTAYGNEVVFKTSTVDVKDVDEVNTAIKIYPNPAKDQITITGLEKVEDIQLINTIGQIVKQYNNVNEAITISITDLSQGIYFLRIGSYVKKLVIKN